MEKGAGSTSSPRVSPKEHHEEPQSHTVDLDQNSIRDSFHDEERPPEAVDLEQNAMGESLSRVASGPPYSIFSHRTKLFIVASVSVSALISPFGATTFYPALNVLAAQLNVTPAMVNLSLTTYMVRLSLENQSSND
jgi:hypothetical protein